MKRFRRVALALIISGAFVGNFAYSQDSFPSKPVTMVVGFAPGGATDFLARLLAREFSEEFKKPFIVVNKPGANSGLAMSSVATAPSDGHTLLLVPVGLAVNELFYNKVTYSIKDFEPIGLIAKMPNVIIVNKKLNVSSLKELVDYSVNHPKKEVAFAAPAAGSSAHLSSELLRRETKANLLHIPYNGDAPSIVAVKSGVVDIGLVNLSAAAGLIKSGDFTALAVTTAKRAPNFPDIPTIAESGVPNYEVSSYYGLGAPAGTPPEIVEKLNKSLMRILEQPAVKTKIAEMGFITENNSPVDFKKFLISENNKWRVIVKESGMKPVN
ncbi:Bug family tripartite tricarboxylate transporter substrate binding protein [Noviherbaspirillum sp. Root189]|uniref:Bug family tripartite tricarboxylate transporter substrate binding protein n=1 Tax=Noviherbaspirillum sp. Root189 TaxID=1736487 RepID=UPI00070B44C6|nr:tripartite tricarboxylate transporter substrate binding protein [Noviherbaspirillum sp. Root189]KRB81549.1 hypothetical protein ASE07_24335 [Noviherbaspirillum sp. Root189]